MPSVVERFRKDAPNAYAIILTFAIAEVFPADCALIRSLPNEPQSQPAGERSRALPCGRYSATGAVSVESATSSAVGALASGSASSSGARGGALEMGVEGSVTGGANSMTAGEVVAASVGDDIAALRREEVSVGRTGDDACGSDDRAPCLA